MSWNRTALVLLEVVSSVLSVHLSQRRALALLIAISAVLGAAFMGLGPPGDVTIAESCRGSAWEVWRHPQPEDPTAEFDYGRACNEGAAGSVYISIGLLGVAAVSLAAAAWPQRTDATEEGPVR